MSSDIQTRPSSKTMVWAGYIVSALPALMMTFSAIMKLVKPTMVVEEFTRLGYEESVIIAIGVVELGCVALYLAPQTAVLGAILLTGYLGGATATHVRLGEAFIGPIVFGVLAWLGLYLREPRLRALVPWRK
jgi:hypothetical protein